MTLSNDATRWFGELRVDNHRISVTKRDNDELLGEVVNPESNHAALKVKFPDEKAKGTDFGSQLPQIPSSHHAQISPQSKEQNHCIG